MNNPCRSAAKMAGMVEATFEIGPRILGGTARALRAWLDLDPPVDDPTFDRHGSGIQRVGATKLLAQIEQLLLTPSSQELASRT